MLTVVATTALLLGAAPLSIPRPQADGGMFDAGTPDAGESLAEAREFLVRAKALMEDGRTKDALPLLLEAKKLVPNDCDVLAELEEAQSRHGDPKAAARTHGLLISQRCNERDTQQPPGDYPGPGDRPGDDVILVPRMHP